MSNHVLLRLMYVFVFLVPQVSLGATYYVSKNGYDGNDGSSSAPFLTIKKAASVVKSGDIVQIREGTYVEKSITPAASGSSNNYICFQIADNTGNVVLKHPANSVDDKTPVFNLSNRSHIWIEGLRFKDFKYGLASIYISNGNNNVITSNIFQNLGNAEVGYWSQNQVVGIFNGCENVVTNNFFDRIVGDGVNVNS
ncbi:MAG: DUF1565 domain-containing protein [Cellvibrionaceae bacterium]|nr:DUF1565 domain-containing protein [Cellvibrionaceae bacterium]